ncbi:hypothetical protein V8G54_037933 (chloroplast) [Vigna mungo]|uniref:AP complex subunit sigma n=1 Tax=Vigna mungo TaxID=3915 RepID=A0AAQ3MDZ3_VIGMU
MIRFILLQNRQGKTRLAKYYVPLEDSEKHKVEYEVHRLVVNRDPKYTNFVEVNFLSAILIIMLAELLQRFCLSVFLPFDVVIGHHIERIFFLEIIITIFDRLLTHVYLILDEFILAGELQETSKKAIIERMGELEKLE